MPLYIFYTRNTLDGTEVLNRTLKLAYPLSCKWTDCFLTVIEKCIKKIFIYYVIQFHFINNYDFN